MSSQLAVFIGAYLPVFTYNDGTTVIPTVGCSATHIGEQGGGFDLANQGAFLFCSTQSTDGLFKTYPAFITNEMETAVFADGLQAAINYPGGGGAFMDIINDVKSDLTQAGFDISNIHCRDIAYIGNPGWSVENEYYVTVDHDAIMAGWPV